ncbi:hexamerin-like [Macrosteles quadrilineatus]|uniref:hexamerin-like n=1 Tax=Macrosteles quadrilineatus TaxID=74068 RepID=UPI0023E26281|nr:hexamerin-like [Macrosteles quadrilineatus]
MKFTALLLCGLALAAAGPQGQQGNQSFNEKQQNLLKLFVNVQQPNYNQDQQQIGNNFNFNNQNFNNANAVKQFQNAYQQGLLPRGQVFNYNNPNQLQQAIQLFDVFYFAKDFDTFYQAACWARDRVNEGQFVYALSVAIVKRQDTQGVVLPPQSEVYPNLYVNAQAIQQAQNNKQQGQKQAVFQSNNTNNYVQNQQQKQQQHQQQQQQQQQGNQNQYQQLFNNQYQNNQNYDNENLANQYQNQQQQNQEARVAYFSEDINLNQQFANQQIFNPTWFNQQKYNQKNQNANQGENFFYYLQQVLARYNLERYANNLPNVQPFQFNQNVQPGYNPQLQYHNGQAVPARPNNVNINNANNNYLQQLQNIDRRIADAVDSQQVKNDQGTKQALNAENGVAVLGNIVQANENSVNNQYYAANNGFYGYFDVFRKVVGSIVDPNNQYQAAPGAIETNSAALRDPVFYQVIARVVNYFQNFKNQLKPYNKEQVNFDGVQVQSVNVDKLVTYFDNNEVDLYNAINYQQGEQAENYQYKAQQQQLNNKPFNYQIQVNSQQEADAIVRVFIGPQYDAQGNQYTLEQARQNFVEIDRFVTKLQNGQNQIQRNSQQSTRFVQQQPNTRAIFNQAQQGNLNYNQTQQQQQQYTLPQNLILPKGSQNGQQYVFVVAVNQYQPNNNNNNQNNQDNNQNQNNDNRPQGFPFDRQVQANTFQQAKNVFFQTVTVYNKNNNNNNNNNNQN